MQSLTPQRQNIGCARSPRITRWGPESQTAQLNGLKTAITTAMTPEQVDAYALCFRIEELGQKIRAGDPAPKYDSKRSPSPTPEYDETGRRIDTRQSRYRHRLEEEFQALLDAASKTVRSYQIPRDYRKFQRSLITDKVYIPVKDFPDVNFIGQILGPRGQSLADMNKQSGPNIVIRGKGSKVNDAKKLVSEVIEAAASAPEDQNQRKRDQLRLLAVMNGTFRDDERRACKNCGQTGHRHYFCTMPSRFVASITCLSCKEKGHVTRDCPQKSTGHVKLPPWRERRLDQRLKAIDHDDEFEQLMLEIGN
ncbi:branchpoint-bridging protein [Diaporthe amygdali]|uniref:branchpoint-bridging protein n=1 Tax=Phomopsis amygdali TaxID=1214568 RepID=UPI0022FE132D|nr:branchpoint-bridging protein [Diaporthe amygdali]KAJ0119551.1 branchpoint-bridging protein [Diaporthe amygdali]